MRIEWQPAAFGAFSSSLIFLAVVQLGLGPLFWFLPAIPLLALGLSRPAETLVACTLLALLFICFLVSPAASLIYTACLSLPVLLFAPRAITFPTPRETDSKGYYAIGRLLLDLAIYAALVFLSLEAHLSPENGLRGALNATLQTDISKLDPDMQTAITAMLENGAFMIIGITVWWWALMLYAHAIIANRMLRKNKKHVRLRLSIEPFSLPAWLLGVVAILALASFSGGDIAFIAKTLLIIFLLPYFIMGASVANLRMRNWPNRNIWLFLLYAASLILAWPALILAGIGLWEQCKTLTKTDAG